MTHATDAHPVSLSASTVAAMLRLGVGLDELGGATVTGATGVLAGTTGTDTHLTISATTASCREASRQSRSAGTSNSTRSL